MSDIVKVLRDLCDNNYNESISLEGLDAMEAAISEIQNLRVEVKQLKGDLSVANLQIEAKEKDIERLNRAILPFKDGNKYE